MAAYGYSHVPDRGFHAFLGDLEEGAWKEISIDKYDAPDHAAPLLLEAPRPVAWKLRARWSIARLDEVLAVASDDVLRSLDAAWDSAQRAFDYTVAAAEEHEDAAVRTAATRVRRAMLKGGGTAQTTLTYGAEVDFGRSQLEAAKTVSLSSAKGGHRARQGSARDQRQEIHGGLAIASVIVCVASDIDA